MYITIKKTLEALIHLCDVWHNIEDNNCAPQLSLDYIRRVQSMLKSVLHVLEDSQKI